LTDSRERYVEALLAVALANSSAAFTPASAFLRRQLLKKRVARILQETTMTTRRLIASLTASAAVLALTATVAVRSFPLEAQGQAPANTGEPIQLVKGGEHLLHGEQPEYPKRAIEKKIEGDVVVEMTLDDRGEVSDARVLSGPEELRKATLEAVLQWHYAPSAISSTLTQATVRFHLPADSFEKAEVSGKVDAVQQGVEGPLRAWAFSPPQHLKARLMAIEKALANPATTDGQRAELKAKFVEMQMMMEKIRADRKEPIEVELVRDGEPESHVLRFVKPERPLEQKFEGTQQLVEVRTERVSEATAKELLAQAGVAVGDLITEETAKRIGQAAAAMDEHFRVEFGGDGKGGIVLTLLTR
jgi:TonB family protein